jgi:hypothetical protein
MADAPRQTKPAASLENRLVHVKGIFTVFYRI